MQPLTLVFEPPQTVPILVVVFDREPFAEIFLIPIPPDISVYYQVDFTMSSGTITRCFVCLENSPPDESYGQQQEGPIVGAVYQTTVESAYEQTPIPFSNTVLQDDVLISPGDLQLAQIETTNNEDSGLPDEEESHNADQSNSNDNESLNDELVYANNNVIVTDEMVTSNTELDENETNSESSDGLNQAIL